MRLVASRQEISGLLTWFLADPKWKFVLDTVRDNVTFTGKSILFNKKILIGVAKIRMDVYPTTEGYLEMDIQEVSIAGIPIMSVARKKAGEIILKTLAPYANIIRTWKHQNGNIRGQIIGIKFTEFAVSGDTLTLNAQLTTVQ